MVNHSCSKFHCPKVLSFNSFPMRVKVLTRMPCNACTRHSRRRVFGSAWACRILTRCRRCRILARCDEHSRWVDPTLPHVCPPLERGCLPVPSFRGGPVFQTHTLLYHSTLRLDSNTEEEKCARHTLHKQEALFNARSRVTDT